jgi:endonuclease YncB( thermonuclease family)
MQELSVASGAHQDAKENRQASRRLAQALGKVIALVLIVGLVLLIERYWRGEVPPLAPGAKIVAIDGDSLRASNGVEYRLFGIDAPELHQTCQEATGKSWLCGRTAKAKLATIIKRGNVNCEARAKDHFGRIVAICSAEGVADIAEAIVRNGYAIALGFATRNYQDAQVEAEVAKRGIWRGRFEVPAAWRAGHPRVAQ